MRVNCTYEIGHIVAPRVWFCSKYRRVNFLINVLHLLPSGTIFSFRSLQHKLRGSKKKVFIRLIVMRFILNAMYASNEIYVGRNIIAVFANLKNLF